MIELRWYSSDNRQRRLQYRQQVDITVRAGMWPNEDLVRTANYQWTEWQDVPEVHGSDQYSGSNSCPKCGLDTCRGAMGYVCVQSGCPLGFGSSIS